MVSRALVVTDLGYGDSGKGSITDFLAGEIEASLVVRYNGGAQAAHRVVRTDGREHVFAQWGSGTFQGARTLLSKHVVVHPFALVREAEALQRFMNDPWDRLLIDENCTVVTPFQQAINRLKEYSRGQDRHGSCGIGIGEAVVDRFQEYSIKFGDLRSIDLLRRKLHLTKDVKVAVAEQLDTSSREAQDEVRLLKELPVDDLCVRLEAIGKLPRIVTTQYAQNRINRAQTLVFEGAQGVLLDMHWGFHPYSTWSNCTDENAREMLKDFDGKVERVGVVRAYTTRHGPGPFVPYDEGLTRKLPDDRNGFHPFQREFRCGWFDVPAIQYALKVNKGVDYLAVTCLDRIAELGEWGWCSGYRLRGEEFKLSAQVKEMPTTSKQMELTEELMKCKPTFIKNVASKDLSGEMSVIENQLGLEVGLVSRGPTCEDKEWQL